MTIVNYMTWGNSRHVIGVCCNPKKTFHVSAEQNRNKDISTFIDVYRLPTCAIRAPYNSTNTGSSIRLLDRLVDQLHCVTQCIALRSIVPRYCIVLYHVVLSSSLWQARTKSEELLISVLSMTTGTTAV